MSSRIGLNDWKPTSRMENGINIFPFTGLENTYLLFDNGQFTYFDGRIQGRFLKDRVQKGTGPLAILFVGTAAQRTTRCITTTGFRSY